MRAPLVAVLALGCSELRHPPAAPSDAAKVVVAEVDGAIELVVGAPGEPWPSLVFASPPEGLETLWFPIELAPFGLGGRHLVDPSGVLLPIELASEHLRYADGAWLPAGPGGPARARFASREPRSRAYCGRAAFPALSPPVDCRPGAPCGRPSGWCAGGVVAASGVDPWPSCDGDLAELVMLDPAHLVAAPLDADGTARLGDARPLSGASLAGKVRLGEPVVPAGSRELFVYAADPAGPNVLHVLARADRGAPWGEARPLVDPEGRPVTGGSPVLLGDGRTLLYLSGFGPSGCYVLRAARRASAEPGDTVFSALPFEAGFDAERVCKPTLGCDGWHLLFADAEPTASGRWRAARVASLEPLVLAADVPLELNGTADAVGRVVEDPSCAGAILSLAGGGLVRAGPCP